MIAATLDIVPKDLDEALEILEQKFKVTEGFQEWLALDEQKALGISHRISRHIRNSWGLWDGSVLRDWFLSQGIHYTNDMSNIILRCLHRKLNNKALNSVNLINNAIAYWKVKA
jgi:hypothetical protein